jgi:Spy/CpxP family protein refolding chaperone
MADSRMRIWFALFVLAVFCFGAAAGILIGMRMDRSDVPWRRLPGADRAAGLRGGPGAGPPPQVLLERLTRELDLDQSQREQIRTVLEASRGRVIALQRDVRGRFDDEQRTLREEIRKVLTPEQQEKFERTLERRPRGRGRGGGAR